LLLNRSISSRIFSDGVVPAVPDPQLMHEINSIAAIDNHTHVPKVVRAGEKDDDYDALPCAPWSQLPIP
jgi:hypothetical protein